MRPSPLLNFKLLNYIPMIKATVLYGHPTDAGAFESYYAEIHTPLALKMIGLTKFEVTKFISGPGGSKPEYYRMAELYFSSPEEFQKAMGSPEGMATSADLANFATGGVTILVGTVG